MNLFKNFLSKKNIPKLNEKNNSVIEAEPKILYKYRDWNKKFHKNSIVDNEIYFSSPKDFNDPFDCKLTKNFSLLNTEEKKTDYINKIIKGDKNQISENEKIKIREKILKNFNDLNEFQKKHQQYYEFIHDLKIGIFSMSSRWDSILMWSHYSNFHKGFCVGYDADLMQGCRALFGKFGKVAYSKSYPKYDPNDKIEEGLINMPFLKSEDWKYEKEYRFVQVYPNQFSGRVHGLGDEFIKEINLGLMISKRHKKEILTVCKDKDWNLYQIVKTPFEFELNREKID